MEVIVLMLAIAVLSNVAATLILCFVLNINAQQNRKVLDFCLRHMFIPVPVVSDGGCNEPEPGQPTQTPMDEAEPVRSGTLRRDDCDRRCGALDHCYSEHCET